MLPYRPKRDAGYLIPAVCMSFTRSKGDSKHNLARSSHSNISTLKNRMCQK
uniref:Uncharacterized protein n=1 Tax=Utricularia reniformis TaxID=192314 RepID=A0A1Y0B1Y9_9LAMI|nr:hypothetical protein AEK19_MT1192 [Utricularia reniformis]ART31404.1 hypothetical protein AEK19_MT1192 [Utricularia reniformis]